MTLILKLDPLRPEREKIERAAEFIRAGEVVAFPTETVYGLGANALSPSSVRKIFAVKRRPLDNPLIIHVARAEQVEALVEEIPPAADRLIQSFWPGPLTLILRKLPSVPEEATAGLETLAVRMPDHRVALELIEVSSTPIAAPSANLSGRPSSTRAEHVIEDFYSRIACIIDSGQCRIGVESTVAMVRGDKIVILRPGGISREEMERATGKPVEYHRLVIEAGGEEKPVSPGMKYRHYAPRAELWLVPGEKLVQVVKEALERSGRVGVIARREKDIPGALLYKAGTGIEEYSSNLFSALRSLDSKRMEIIVAEAVEEVGMGMAAMNRLKKAATRIIG